MENYANADKRRKGMIDGVNANRLKQRYSSDEIRILADARTMYLDRSGAAPNSTDEQRVIRDYLRTHGFDMSKLNGANNIGYQAKIAYRISQGEFGGLPEKKAEAKTLETRVESTETSKPKTPKASQGTFDF